MSGDSFMKSYDSFPSDFERVSIAYFYGRTVVRLGETIPKQPVIVNRGDP